MELIAIQDKVFTLRGQKVMLDFDLAEMYEVETRSLKQAVRRNIDRFPEDFMFELTKTELENLRSQNVISTWGALRFLPCAFTEQGVAMLSSVLKKSKSTSSKHHHYARLCYDPAILFRFNRIETTY